MDEKMLEALKASIEHWRENETGPLVDASIWGSDCALCEATDGDEDDECKGCPVFSVTGRNACSGTPYLDALKTFLRRSTNEAAWRAAARAEREFLESLLPGDGK